MWDRSGGQCGVSPWPLGWSVCAEHEGLRQLLLRQLWGVCRVVEYRDVFSGGGEKQQDILFSKITFLPNPVRRITQVDL